MNAVDRRLMAIDLPGRCPGVHWYIGRSGGVKQSGAESPGTVQNCIEVRSMATRGLMPGLSRRMFEPVTTSGGIDAFAPLVGDLYSDT
jgi:hypothetical protein